MGPVDWIAVVMAALLAVVVGMVWYGPMFRFIQPCVTDEPKERSHFVMAFVVMLIGATMLGHNYARIGAETMAAKPWLYFMQSGGIALFFIIPVLWMTYYRFGSGQRLRLVACGYYLVAYLVMGTVFWALA